MAANASNLLEQTLAQLWRATRDPATPSDVLSTLLGQTRSFLDQEPPDSLAAARARSALAALLCEIAERSSDEHFVRKSVAELVAIRPQGMMLAASLFGAGQAQDRQLRHVYGSLDPAVQLALINRLLARPRLTDPKIAQWAAEEVHAIQSDDPEEALVFLESLSRTGETPSYPVQREMVHGRFGFWLQELVGKPLSAEQARYMLETASLLEWRPLGRKLPLLLRNARPEDMPAVFAAIGRPDVSGGDKTVKAAVLFLKHKDPGTRLAAAGALVDLHSARAVPALALLCGEAALLPSAVAQALRLDAADFARLVLALPEKARPVVLCQALGLLIRLLPETTARAVAALGDGPEAAAVKALLRGRKKLAPKPAFTPAPPRPYQKADDEGGSLLGKVKRLFGAGGDEAAPGEGQAALDAVAPGAKVAGRTINGAEAPGKNLSKTSFENCTLKALDLNHAALGGTRLTGCRLVDLDLGQARMKDVVFQDCELSGCRLSGAALEKVTLIRCTLRRCHLDGVTAARLRTESCRFWGCTLWGLRGEFWTARSCAFQLTDFSRAALVGADLDGVCFEDCQFLGTFASDTRVDNAATRACVFHDCAFAGISGDEPSFLEWEERTRRAQARGAVGREQAAPAPGPLATAQGVRAMRMVAEAVLHERDLARRRRVALRANRRRLDWCAAKLGPEAAKVLAMLPGLLERGGVRTAAGLEPAPAAVIEGWTPDLDTLAWLDKHFEDPGPKPGAKAAKSAKTPAPDPKAPPALRIQAFYSIGSVGTIAQTKGSDIDMWVCYDETATDPKDAAAFQRKLAAIEAWAEAEHGLELHFFLMDLAKVRDNNFGFSDKESAGSSQALLLKEEFYRTAVLLAGRKLAWWLLPPGTTGQDYKKGLARIARAASLPQGDTVDLGAMEAVPRGEFFGASLWQIVKALKSPFKSIMKFALLDAYLAGDDADVLLCNRLKQGLSEGRRDFWSVDPYAVLYREIDQHYARLGNGEARELLRMAFEQKTGFSQQGRTSGRPADLAGHSYLEFFFPYSLDEQPGGAQQSGLPAPPQTFARIHDLGQKVARFMFGTYQNMNKALSGVDEDATITGEDLTRLGRRIFGHFQAKPDKILHTPFVASPSRLFASLEIACEGIPGTPLTWVARGEHPKRDTGKSEYEEVRRGKNPLQLLAWMWANQVYSPALPLMGKDLHAPISLPDLRALAEAMAAALPLHDVFEPEIEQSLQDEELTRAFLCINFLSDRDIKEYKDVVLVYATNWGELFCITAPKGIKYLEKDVREFLAANTSARIAADVALAAFQPARSQAPRPVLV